MCMEDEPYHREVLYYLYECVGLRKKAEQCTTSLHDELKNLEVVWIDDEHRKKRDKLLQKEEPAVPE